MEFQIGCDVGGTFTDVVAVDSHGVTYEEKAETTPEDLTVGVLHALNRLADSAGCKLDELLSNASRFVNGTTTVTNSIAELRGARTGLLTTKGFGDNLLIARSARNASRDYHKQLNLPQIVPRDLVVEVSERIDRKGHPVVALTEAEARRAVGELTAKGVEAIAVSLLWSFVNPVHEDLLASVVEREHPGVFLSVASRLHPVIREYERTMTAVLNAFTGLATASYANRIEQLLAGQGLRVPVTFMQGLGGTLSAKEARSEPIALVDSGPAGGVIGAQDLARRLGIQHVVAADMGGTSFDVSVLHNRRVMVTQRVMLRDQFLTALSKIDVLPIGAGGGSIAWLDARGVPQVGPQSAGAEPGPVCYGTGGVAPTVTDAAAVLGLLNPAAFLGGRRTLDVGEARDAILEKVGKPLGLDPSEAAAAIYRLVTANMSNAVRSVTVERGRDPRQFSLLAYGGALGIFAADIARSLGIRQVVIPATAAVFSARGLLASDDVRTRARSQMWSGGDAAAVLDSLHQLEEQLVSALREVGYTEDCIAVEWQGDFKFLGQQWELRVPIPRKDDLSEGDLEAIRKDFPELYEAEYGRGTAWRGAPIQLMSVRVVATGRAVRPEAEAAEIPAGDKAGEHAPASREVFLPNTRKATSIAVYNPAALASGNAIGGPAIIDHPLAAIQVPDGWELTVDHLGNYVLSDRSSPSGTGDADHTALRQAEAVGPKEAAR